ncbi:quinone oxidoreductase family protein [Croceibacterium ferulae]|uniref:quinone oxidoreductase family protein n=1 Tax=Croceibacterium ferulae TaxID=1854641 RepID=UPI000EAE1AD8|nr:zinc-binding alcohol dehydrogenase family protein [Croceibacterium ferulae]
MRAFVASSFSGFTGLTLRDIPSPTPAEDRLLVRVVAAGVNVVDHSILHGKMPMVTSPLVLGNEGAGIVEHGDTDFPTGTRVAFGGPFGVLEQGTYAEFVAVPKAMLYRVPANINLIEAAGLPVAYISAFIALEMAGFAAGKIVYAPGVFGGIGNATLQLARALGAKQVISSTASSEKASRAHAAGFDHVIDMSTEPLVAAVRRMTEDYGVDVVVDGLSGPILSASLSVLATQGTIVTVGYSAGREANIDVTNLIWKSGQIKGFNFLLETPERWELAWESIQSLLAKEEIRPIVDQVFSFEETADAMRYLVEERPSGRVIVAL